MDFRTFVDASADLIGSISPSLIGSAAAQAWKPHLSWRQRFVQWAVGSVVSYYATLAIVAVTHWSGFVAQSIAFGIALLAFDATRVVQGRDRCARQPARSPCRPLHSRRTDRPWPILWPIPRASSRACAA
jgi:hypothetical protein